MTTNSITEHRLSNGLLVVACPDGNAPSVAVAVTYRVGSRDDPPGRTGMAHLFEHLMFEGSRNVDAGEHLRLVQACGGVCNAETSADVTVTYQQVPPGAFELALWLEADRLATLPEALSEPALAAQRQVAIQERLQRLGQPAGALPERALAALFRDHPYEHNPVGRPEDLERVSLDDLRGHYARWFQPGNAVLTVVGDIVPDRVIDLAEKYLAPIPNATAAAANTADGQVVREPLAAPVHVEVQEPGLPYPVLGLAFRGPANSATDSEIFAFYLALQILAEGEHSRAYRRLVHADDIAHDVAISVDPMDHGSVGIITAFAMPGTPATEVEDTLGQELRQLADEGPTAAEVRKARAITGRDILHGNSKLLARATGLGRFAAGFGNPGAQMTQADRLNQVDVDEIRRAAAWWLHPDHRAAITFQPTEPSHLPTQPRLR